MKLKEIEDDMIIHCSTKEQAKILVEETNSERTFIANWDNYTTETCYRMENGKTKYFGRFSFYYDEENEEVIEFSDLIIPEHIGMTAEEVLEWLKNHYEVSEDMAKTFGYDCNMIHLLKKFSANEIIKHIQEFESKKNEVMIKNGCEWVWVGRIYKINCIGAFVQVPHSLMDIQAESREEAEEFWAKFVTDYMLNNEGEYAGTVERIYRKKVGTENE